MTYIKLYLHPDELKKIEDACGGVRKRHAFLKKLIMNVVTNERPRNSESGNQENNERRIKIVGD